MTSEMEDSEKSNRFGVEKPSGSVNVPSGQWIDVKPGQIMAPGTYVDEHGVLRCVANDAVAVWHLVRKEGEGEGDGRCERTGITPEEIRYDPETKVPWCPDCWNARVNVRAWATVEVETKDEESEKP